MNCNIAVIKGDGIGPEVVTQAMKVLDAVGEKFGHTFNYEQLLMGGCSIDACGVPLTDEAVAMQYCLVPSAVTQAHHLGTSFHQRRDRKPDF